MAAIINQSGDAQFTVFIRLPFPRGDFVDPPPVEWNATKDRALWDVLSRPSKGNDIDWKALAESFGVTLQFLLQQAAWLYNRQLSQVRAQMRRVRNTHSNSPSPVPGSIYASTALGQITKAGQSSGPQVPSRLLSQQKESVPQQQASIPRRTSSGNTVNQIKGARESSHTETSIIDGKEPKREGHSRQPSLNRREQTAAVAAAVHKSPTLVEEDLTSSSSSSSSESDSDGDNNVGRRRGIGFKRFQQFSIHQASLRDDDDDEDESPAFLPLSHKTGSIPRDTLDQDLNATLRLDQEKVPVSRQRVPEPAQNLRKLATAKSSTSSISSGAPATLAPSNHRNQLNHPSPQRAADLARSSPRRSTTSGRDISDGSPSIGSSFSDLENTSVTQSMLEEALLSNMQHAPAGNPDQLITITRGDLFGANVFPGRNATDTYDLSLGYDSSDPPTLDVAVEAWRRGFKYKTLTGGQWKDSARRYGGLSLTHPSADELLDIVAITYD